MNEVNPMSGNNASTDLAREILEESEESAYTYLVEGWLASTIEKLWDARRQAGLTQQELAQRLGTKQPAIARLEKDNEGRISLRRYIEYALACGVLPLDISLKPAGALREFAINNSGSPRTERSFEAWSRQVPALGNVDAPIASKVHRYLLSRVEPHVDVSSLFTESTRYEPSHQVPEGGLSAHWEYADFEPIWEAMLGVSSTVKRTETTAEKRPDPSFKARFAHGPSRDAAAAA